jgi:pimeloyl-ACP methyl ester carboxylesterase
MSRAEFVLNTRDGRSVHGLLRGARPREKWHGVKGRTVIMLPSLGRAAEDFDHLGLALADAGYSSVALQPRGIGGSKGPMDGVSLDDLAADVALVIESRLEPHVTLIGHAFGNRLARNVARLYPDKVSRVALLACGGQVPMSTEALHDLMSCFDLTLPPQVHLEHVRRAFFADGNDPAVWKDGWYPAIATMQSAAVRNSDHSAWKLGGGQPMLIVQALQDAIAPPANAQALVDAAPERMTLVEIDHAGHAMLPEQPDAIAKAVIDWLDN